jgi:hypothetical protein
MQRSRPRPNRGKTVRRSQVLRIMRDWFRASRPIPEDLPQLVAGCLREAPGDFNRVCGILKDRFDVEMEPDELRAFMTMVVDVAQKVRARCN